MMISTSNKVALVTLLSVMIIAPVAASQHYYGSTSTGITQAGETGFAMPDFANQQELVAELVMPFLLISIILQMGFKAALGFAFAEDDDTTPPWMRDEGPDVSTEATIMAVAVTAMMVPTPAWGILRNWIVPIVGAAPVIAFFAVLLYLTLKNRNIIW